MSCYKDIKDNYKNDIKNHEEYSKLATYQEEMEWLPEDLRFDAYIGPDSDSAIKHLIAILEKIPHFTGGSSLKREFYLFSIMKLRFSIMMKITRSLIEEMEEQMSDKLFITVLGLSCSS